MVTSRKKEREEGRKLKQGIITNQKMNTRALREDIENLVFCVKFIINIPRAQSEIIFTVKSFIVRFAVGK